MSDKIKHWHVVASASVGERVQRVPGAFHFALPFVMDQDVDWAPYFDEMYPRAFLVGVRPEGHAKAGEVYPLDLAVVNGANAEAANAEAANFIGLVIDGTDYERDRNVTVTLAAGVRLDHIQQRHDVPLYTVDPAVVAAAPKLGIKILSRNAFWNTIQSGNVTQ